VVPEDSPRVHGAGTPVGCDLLGVSQLL